MKQILIMLAVAFGALAGAQADETPKPIGTPITWTTSDGVKMVGLYQAALPGHKTWIFLHGLGSNKQEWLPFVKELVKQGEGFLIYDARGHGDSTKTSQGSLSYVDAKTAGPGSLWDHMTGDLESAVQLLEGRSVDVKTMGVGGASLGANVALLYASRAPAVPALLLLSPGLEYAGIKSEEPFRDYGVRPVFIAASPGDAYAYASVRQLILKRKDPQCRLASGEGAAHGVNMLNAAMTQKILDWMKGLK